MWRVLFLSGILLVLVASPAAAAISLSINDLPADYAPGDTLTFRVNLTGVTDLHSYNLGLALTSNRGVAGTDFFFLGSPDTRRPLDGTDYVFDPSLGVTPFGFVAEVDTVVAGANTSLLSLSDFLTGAGQVVSLAPGHTVVATAVIGTTALAGDLRLSFDGAVLELLNASRQPVAEATDLMANLESFNPPPVLAQDATVIPEPSSLAVWSLLGVLVAVAVRRWSTTVR